MGITARLSDDGLSLMIWRKRLGRLLSLVLISVTPLACQAPPTFDVEIGMTVHFRGADAASLTRQFDLMTAMHVTWVRMDIDWSVVEPEQGDFDWSYPDKLFREAAARGMKVLAVLAFSPEWARPSATADPGIISHSRPDQLSDYGNFARIAAQRYAPQGVRNWEIWNEPNSITFWPPGPDPDEYGDLFREAAAAIRAVDPKATLLIGGLAPKYRGPDAGMSPAEHLVQLYANGTAQLADGVAVHPYTFPALPKDARQHNVGGLNDLPALHTVMSRHGDGGKKIWITEFGAPTGTGPNAVSDDDQAAALLKARQMVGHWDWAGPLIYYELVDGGTDPTDIELNFGVLREDLSPKPAALALMRDD